MKFKYINLLLILLVFGCQAEKVKEVSKVKEAPEVKGAPKVKKEVKQAPERMEIADDLPYFIKQALLDLRNRAGSSRKEPDIDNSQPQAEDKVEEQPQQLIKPDIKQEEPVPEQNKEEVPPPEEEVEEEVIEIYLEGEGNDGVLIIR